MSQAPVSKEYFVQIPKQLRRQTRHGLSCEMLMPISSYVFRHPRLYLHIIREMFFQPDTLPQFVLLAHGDVPAVMTQYLGFDVEVPNSRRIRGDLIDGMLRFEMPGYFLGGLDIDKFLGSRQVAESFHLVIMPIRRRECSIRVNAAGKRDRRGLPLSQRQFRPIAKDVGGRLDRRVIFLGGRALFQITQGIKTAMRKLARFRVIPIKDIRDDPSRLLIGRKIRGKIASHHPGVPFVGDQLLHESHHLQSV